MKTVWMLAATTAMVGLMGTATPAEACSWYEMPTLRVAAKATPTEVAMMPYGGSAGTPSLTVLDSSGAVDGEFTEAEGYNGVTVFTPSEPLEPGTYTVEMNTEGEQESLTAEFEVLAEPAELEIDVDLVPGIYRDWTSIVCCSTETGGCYDSCGSCDSCWPGGYTYTRSLEFTITTNMPVVVQASVSPSASGNGGATLAPILDSGTHMVWNGELGASETCLELQIMDLSGAEIGTETVCADSADFDESDQSQPDEPEAVAACVEPPDDTEDPNWQRYGEKSLGADGCSTTSSQPFLPALLGFVLVALRRRR